MFRLHRLIKLIISGDLLLPLLLIVVYIGLFFILRGVIPSSDDLVAVLASLYGRYGYEIIFFGAAIEALVLVNIFVPGVIAVAFGAVFARSGEVDLTLAILSAASGSLIGYLIDYILGFYGFGYIVEKFSGKEFFIEVRKKIRKYTTLSFILGYIHPNLGSILSLVAGTIKFPFLNFITLTFFATLFWISFWALLFFVFGEVLLVILTKYFFVIVLLILSIWTLAFVSLGKPKKK